MSNPQPGLRRRHKLSESHRGRLFRLLAERGARPSGKILRVSPCVIEELATGGTSLAATVRRVEEALDDLGGSAQ